MYACIPIDAHVDVNYTLDAHAGSFCLGKHVGLDFCSELLWLAVSMQSLRPTASQAAGSEATIPEALRA